MRLIIEIVVGSLTAFLGLLIAGIAVLQIGLLFQQAPRACSVGSCDQGVLALILILGLALVILSWAVTTGLFIVRLMQKRYAWFWPLLGIGIVLLGLVIVIALVGMWVNS